MSIEKITEYLVNVREGEDFIRPDVLDPIDYNNDCPDTWVEIENPEFTSLCPKTGLPDLGTIRIKYLPDQKIVELKSLKYYFLQFRNAGIYYENLTKLISGHLVQCLDPFELVVEADFTPRGGVNSRVITRYKKS